MLCCYCHVTSWVGYVKSLDESLNCRQYIKIYVIYTLPEVTLCESVIYTLTLHCVKRSVALWLLWRLISHVMRLWVDDVMSFDESWHIRQSCCVLILKEFEVALLECSELVTSPLIVDLLVRLLRGCYHRSDIAFVSRS